MRTRIALLIFIAFIFSLPPSNAFAKSAFQGGCSGTKLDFSNAKKACASGDFPGETIFTCKKNGKQTDRRTCNSDGAKKGVYINNCSGTATGFSSLKKACQSEAHFGELLVKCKKGEEKNRMQCESAESDDDKVVIFKNNCGSGNTIEGRNLKKACKNNVGETLVKCKRKNNIWKEKKMMLCQGKKDRFKVKKCSPTEQATLFSDYEFAEGRVDTVLAEVEAELANNQGMDKKLRNKMAVVRRKLEKIQTAMDRPRTYICRANKNLCSRANAFTPGRRNVKLCIGYFAKSTQDERASILVHEISHHKTGTNDKGKEHGGCTNPNLSTAANDFHKQAEYYEHIIECGLYVPN